MEKYVSILLEKYSCIENRLLFLTLLLSFVTSPVTAWAAKWQKIARTSSFNISLDTDSVKSGQGDLISAWLSLTPLDKKLRLEASKNFSKADYAQHMELYEFDCTELSATHKNTVILNNAGKRIGIKTETGSAEAILPGSALEKVASKLCPKQEIIENDEITSQEIFPDKTLSENPEQQLTAEQQKRIDDAVAKTTTEPSNFNNWVELGNAYFDADLPKQSIESYDQALKIKPDNVDVLNDQGTMYRKNGEYIKALKIHEKVIAIAPDNLESLYLIGYIYAIELNRTQDAIPYWQKYLSLDSSSETASQVKQYIEKYAK
jgi:tetratricopeptide (TPR) repeat protein